MAVPTLPRVGASQPGRGGESRAVHQEYRFTVPGRPVPKLRHRSRLLGGKIISYTPRKVEEFERTVGWTARAAGVKPFEGPVEVRVTCYIAPSRREPDTDNLLKSVLDGLREVAYRDDVMVYRVVAEKRIVCSRSEERTEVEIREHDTVWKGEDVM